MKRFSSEQSRVLRRRLTWHTIIVLVIYTLVFIVAAFALNAYAVPHIANYIANATGTTRYFDPEDYLVRSTFSELMNQYTQRMKNAGNTIDVMYDDTSDLDYTILDTYFQSLDEATGNASEEENSTANGAAAGSGAGDNGDIAIDTEGLAAERISNKERIASMKELANKDGLSDTDIMKNDAAREAALGTNWRDVPVAEVIFESDTGGDQHIEELTPRKLASSAAWEEYDALNADRTWTATYIPSEAEEGLGPFEARELSTYRVIRSLKIPVALLGYLLGCLVIVLLELRRSLRCFDDLSGAVASLMADRTKPVELPANLSIAQGELNKIRMEALADERAAAAAEQRKNELVAYLAHDIRTPLTSVIGYLSLLDEADSLPPEQRRKYTHTAFQKAESLEGLINEFFEITRYNLQSIPIERSNVSVRLFLQQVTDEFYPQAAQRDVRLHVDAPTHASFFVDADKLARAVGNVLRNAVAYADAGTTVDVEARHVEDGWRLRITDQGREISPAHLESIFEKFYREDAARGTNAGGAGLGLAIAREIVTAHEGDISAASTRGRTTFTILLPDV